MTVVRRAEVGDAAQIAAVHIGTWQIAYAGVFPEEFLASFDVEHRTRWMSERIESGSDVIVSEFGDRITGFCMFGPSHEPDWGEIYAIYVNPDDWSRGHGYELFNETCGALFDQGYRHLLLWVLQDNERGRAFYERQGMSVGKPIRIEEIGGVQVTELRYELGLPEPL